MYCRWHQVPENYAIAAISNSRRHTNDRILATDDLSCGHIVGGLETSKWKLG